MGSAAIPLVPAYPVSVVNFVVTGCTPREHKSRAKVTFEVPFFKWLVNGFRRPASLRRQSQESLDSDSLWWEPLGNPFHGPHAQTHRRQLRPTISQDSCCSCHQIDSETKMCTHMLVQAYFSRPIVRNNPKIQTYNFPNWKKVHQNFLNHMPRSRVQLCQRIVKVQSSNHPG